MVGIIRLNLLLRLTIISEQPLGLLKAFKVVLLDGGTSTNYTLSWDIAGDMIMTVSNTSSNRSYQYEIEVMEVSSTGINSEYTVKFLGMKDFRNKFGRFKFDRVSNTTQIKVAIGAQMNIN